MFFSLKYDLRKNNFVYVKIISRRKFRKTLSAFFFRLRHTKLILQLEDKKKINRTCNDFFKAI